MALRDQPYFPLYVNDFLTDEKLNECSPAATGVYIRIMCLMHKSEVYGKILLKQKYKQNDKQILNFACQLVKFLPYNLLEIENSLMELLDEKVLEIEGDFLIQKRMVQDNEISLKRSKSGSLGGKNTQSNNKKFASKFAKAKSKANTEYENEYENEYEYVNENNKIKGVVFEKNQKLSLFGLIEKFKAENPGKYPDEMYSEFLLYWTAPLQKGTNKGKELWTTEKTFQLASRLATSWNMVWAKRQNQNFNQQPIQNFNQAMAESQARVADKLKASLDL